MELRADRHGHLHVVFAFPYRADIVDAVRAIPGRRFDWDAKEWWAPQADDTAPFVKGVIERHPSLRVADDVRAWLADAADGWVGRVFGDPAGGPWRVRARDDLRRGARGAAAPRSAAVATGSRSRRPRPISCSSCAARGSTSARCAARRSCRSASSRPARRSRWSRASASRASRSTSTGTRTRSPPSSPCPPARRTAARSRSTRTSSSRSSTTCAPTPSTSPPTRRTRWSACGSSTTARSRASAARARTTRPPLAVEAVLGGELQPFQRAGVAYALDARRTFLADEQGLGKTVQALAALEADDAYPAVVICPASLKLNWERETRHWLPHRTLAVVSGTGTVAPAAEITVDQLRHHPRAPRAAGAAPPARAGARRVALRQEPARQADAVGAPAGGVAPARGAAARADRHAGDEPRRGADPRSCGSSAGSRTSAPAPASPAASRASAPRSGSTGTCAAAASSAAPRPTCCRSCPPSARSRSRSRSTTTASTGWRRRT